MPRLIEHHYTENWDVYYERVTFTCFKCEERLQLQAKEMLNVSLESWRRLRQCTGDCFDKFEAVRREGLSEDPLISLVREVVDG